MKDVKYGISKLPETQVNTPYVSGTDFGPALASPPPIGDVTATGTAAASEAARVSSKEVRPGVYEHTFKPKRDIFYLFDEPSNKKTA